MLINKITKYLIIDFCIDNIYNRIHRSFLNDTAVDIYKLKKGDLIKKIIIIPLHLEYRDCCIISTTKTTEAAYIGMLNPPSDNNNIIVIKFKFKSQVDLITNQIDISNKNYYTEELMVYENDQINNIYKFVS